MDNNAKGIINNLTFKAWHLYRLLLNQRFLAGAPRRRQLIKKTY